MRVGQLSESHPQATARAREGKGRDDGCVASERTLPAGEVATRAVLLANESLLLRFVHTRHIGMRMLNEEAPPARSTQPNFASTHEDRPLLNVGDRRSPHRKGPLLGKARQACTRERTEAATSRRGDRRVKPAARRFTKQ